MQIKSDLLSGTLIIILGVLTVGTAVFFLTLRPPPLLPEDIRHTGIDPSGLPPAFLDWLRVVFRTWGGFVAGFSIVLLGIGTFMLTGRVRWLYWATAAGIVVAFGLFFISNVILASDFLWVIAATFLLACGLAVLLVLKSRR